MIQVSHCLASCTHCLHSLLHHHTGMEPDLLPPLCHNIAVLWHNQCFFQALCWGGSPPKFEIFSQTDKLALQYQISRNNTMRNGGGRPGHMHDIRQADRWQARDGAITASLEVTRSYIVQQIETPQKPYKEAYLPSTVRSVAVYIVEVVGSACWHVGIFCDQCAGSVSVNVSASTGWRKYKQFLPAVCISPWKQKQKEETPPSCALTQSSSQ